MHRSRMLLHGRVIRREPATMNESEKGGPQAYGANQRRAQRPGKPQPGKPGIMQKKKAAPQAATKSSARPLTTAAPSLARRSPVSPPVYRPQPVPKVLQ